MISGLSSLFEHKRLLEPVTKGPGAPHKQFGILKRERSCAGHQGSVILTLFTLLHDSLLEKPYTKIRDHDSQPTPTILSFKFFFHSLTMSLTTFQVHFHELVENGRFGEPLQEVLDRFGLGALDKSFPLHK